MSAKGTKAAKKPKVLPLGLSASPDGLSFSQTVSRSGSTVRPSVLSDDDENGSRGRSSSARRSKKTVVKRLTDSTSPTSPLSPTSTIGSGGFGKPRTGLRAQPRPLKVEDCLEKMVEFVNSHDLRPILGKDLSDEELREQLLPQAKIAAKLPINLAYVNRELAMSLAVLSLYDLAVLIDDSISMEFEEAGRRKVAVKSVLSFIADIYGAVSEKKRGIRAIRFLNGNDDLEADNIRTVDQIDDVIDNHEFEGLTRIGTGLMQKILKPFVFDETVKWSKTSGEARKLKQLERPLLIMVITDGAVEGEPPSRLRQAIQSAVDSLKKAGFNLKTTKAIAFQFARVGDDRDAQKFLEHLDNKSSVKDYVDTLSGEDLMEIMGMRTKDQALTEKHQRRMIKLLLGPISSKYDEMESKEKQPKLSQETGYNSADDFDDDEDDFVDGATDDDSNGDGDDDDDDDDDASDSGNYVSQKQANNSGGQGPDDDIDP